MIEITILRIYHMPMAFVNSLFVPQFAREAMIPSPATSPPGFLDLVPPLLVDLGERLDQENGAIKRQLIIVLDKREQPEQANYQQGKAEFEQKYLKTKQQIVFYEWLHDRQRAADVQFAKG